MRELKFRAWNKKTNEYNNFVELTSYKDGSLSITAGENNNAPIGNSDNFIVEQFTGLKDKNGVDIYEGDIVLVPYNFIGRVTVKYTECKYNISGYNLSKLEIVGNANVFLL